MARRVHSDQGGSDALFRLVKEAYEVLHDPGRRAAYDRTIRANGASARDQQARDQQARDQQARDRQAESRQTPLWRRRGAWWLAAAVVALCVVGVVVLSSTDSATRRSPFDPATRRLDFPASTVALATSERIAYAADGSGNLAVLDRISGTMLGSKHVQNVAANSYPQPSIAIAPDGNRVYVAYKANSFLPSPTSVTVADGRTGNRITEFPFPDANSLAVSRDGRELYVAVGGRIVVVDAVNGSVLRDLTVPATALAPTADGRRAYVLMGGTVALVDLSNGATVERGAVVGFTASHLVASPDGGRAYLSGNDTGGNAAVGVYRPGTGDATTAYVARGTSDKPTISAGLDISADGRRLYAVFDVSTSSGVNSAGTLTALDATVPELRALHEQATPRPDCVAGAPDGKQVYVCTSQSVLIVDQAY